MSKIYSFKYTTLIFLALLASIIITNQFINIPVLVYIFISIIYIVICGVGSSDISSGFHIDTICYGETSQKHIAITFDDGPMPSITPKILTVLEAYQAPATFFCIGKRIIGNENLLKRMEKEGHLIGNHTFSHAFWFDFFLPSTVEKELLETNKIVRNIIGKTPKYFRPPYGVTNPAIKKAVKKTNFTTIGWNKRSLDTVIKDEQKIFNRIVTDLKGGDIILFHDVQTRTINILERFLQYTHQNGFKIVSLDELIKKQAYEKEF